MRTLITGSEGFVGSGLEVEDAVMRVDLALGRDILDPAMETMIRRFDPHVVYHLAAHHYVPWTEEHEQETHMTNGVGTALVLGACGPSLEVFVLASSAAVYGFSPDPIPEDAPLAGRSIYARSKRLAETALTRFAARAPEVRCVAARLFNIVGVGDPWPHVLPEIVRNRKDTLKLGNTWPLRDYIHVDDVREALRFLAQNAPKRFSAWNVGTGEATSVTMLVKMVAERSGVDIKTQTSEERARSDDGHLVADPRALTKLGWSAKRTLTRAIDELLDSEDMSANA